MKALYLNPSPATADVLHQAQYALDVKKAVLPLYEEVFDVEYPLPKLDTIVVRVSIASLTFMFLILSLGQ